MTGFLNFQRSQFFFAPDIRQLLERKIEKSRTWFNFEILFPTPNLTSDFETNKIVGDNFYFPYKYTYTSSKCPQSLKKFKGHF